MGISNSTHQKQTKPRKHIFILAGQSNMSGRGGVSHKHWDHFIPPQCQPCPSILRLNAHLQWETAHEPLHSDIDTTKTCGIGPGLPFANAIKSPTHLTALVPCAIGGTKIKQWARGHHLYNNMIKRARVSVNNGDGKIKAIIWYQGESDTLIEQDADCYKGNMERFICDVRQDLGLPLLPFVQVEIASGEGKYVDKVREAQLGISLVNVVCVDAKGLELKEDKLHLTTEGQVKLGQMLADAYLTHFTPQLNSASCSCFGFGF